MMAMTMMIMMMIRLMMEVLLLIFDDEVRRKDEFDVYVGDIVSFCCYFCC